MEDKALVNASSCSGDLKSQWVMSDFYSAQVAQDLPVRTATVKRKDLYRKAVLYINF